MERLISEELGCGGATPEENEKAEEAEKNDGQIPKKFPLPSFHSTPQSWALFLWLRDKKDDP